MQLEGLCGIILWMTVSNGFYFGAYWVITSHTQSEVCIAICCIFCCFAPSEKVFILRCLSISTKYKIFCFLKIWFGKCQSRLMFAAISGLVCYHPSKTPATSAQCLPFMGKREKWKKGREKKEGWTVSLAIDFTAELGYCWGMTICE